MSDLRLRCALSLLALSLTLAATGIACRGGEQEARPLPTATPSAGQASPTREATPIPTPTSHRPATSVPTAAGRLAFFGPDDDVWIVNADGSGKRKLFDIDTTPGESVSLEWSPDGSKLAATKSAVSPGLQQVQILTADGETLLDVPGVRFGGWSPRGDMFAVVREAAPGVEPALLVLDLEGETVIELPYGYDLSFSPDGQRLAFLEEIRQTALWPETRGVLADLQTGKVAPIDPDEDRMSTGRAIFNPGDSSLMAYGDRLIDLTTAEERPLPRAAISWSPDGQFLLLCGGEGWYGGQVVKVETMAPLLEFDMGPQGTDAPCWMFVGASSAWSEDGGLLAHQGEQQTLHIRDMANLTDETVSVSGSELYSIRGLREIQFSPDGARLVFRDQKGVWLVDSDGTGLTLLAEGGHSAAWQPQPSGSAESTIVPVQPTVSPQ